MWHYLSRQLLLAAECYNTVLIGEIYSQQAGWVKRDEHSLLKTATSSLEHSSLTQPEWLYNRAL